MSNYRIINDYRNLHISDGKLSDTMFEPKLYQSLCIPSTMHAYSCAIEYMRDWFLSKFRKDFFKYIYINGRNLYLDFKQFNKEEMLKRQKPMLSITPVLNPDFDNDTGDLHEFSGNMWRRKRNFQQSFFQDKINNIFIAFEPELIEMSFTYKIRVESRGQQLDLWNYMKTNLRIGATNTEYIAIDFHLPKNIIFAIAELAKFRIKKNKDNEPISVAKPIDFLHYLNNNSALPITYKMRTINGNPEFFVRVPGVPIHIKLDDKISLSDGDQKGMSSDNYELDFSVRMRMPSPKYYVLYSTSAVYNNISLSEEDTTVGLYNIKITEVPEVNSRGWNQLINTEYEDDILPEDNPYIIDISPLLDLDNVNTIIDNSIKNYISPESFLEVHAFNNGYEIEQKIEYNSINDIKMIITNNKLQSTRTFIVVYADLDFINNQIAMYDNITSSRMKKE